MLEGYQIRADMARTAQNMMYTIWSKLIPEEDDPALQNQFNAEAAYVQNLQHDTHINLHDDDDYDPFGLGQIDIDGKNLIRETAIPNHQGRLPTPSSTNATHP